MVIRIAAHPEKNVVHPIGNAKAQDLTIELGGTLAVIHQQGDVAQLARLHGARAIARRNLLYTTDQLDAIAVRITQAESRSLACFA